MYDIFQIPVPVKTLFNKLPLQTYGPVDKQDDALEHEFNARSYAFEGTEAVQKSINNTFQVGVYKMAKDPSSGCFLASDPWCLFTQLSLCKKNRLRLPGGNKTQAIVDSKPVYAHSVLELSPLASTDCFLPVLVEGYAKRHVRSAAGINEILMSRFSGAEERMYALLLDSVVYDCYMSKVLYRLTTGQFFEVYGGETTSSAANMLISQNHRSDLSRRNDFSLRNRELASKWRLPGVSGSDGPGQLLSVIDENCSRTLLQFQDLLKKSTTLFFLTNQDPSYLDLKLASYVYCLLNLPQHQNSITDFLRQECSTLVEHTQRVIDHFS
ncbi:LAFA_0G18404g1_1 [Lachancea sp. 'fantastica']|nr:LAFA_0G18404g1_1 [Lachancea sp. 'fantastica']